MVDRRAGAGSVEIETIEQGRIRLALVDMLGREVAVLADGELSPGRQTIEMDTHGLSSGGYFLILTTPTVRRTAPVMVEK
jgi:hypothetical protein